MSSDTVALRPASAADAHLLFDWLNAADSLAQKELTAAPITWADHYTWLGRRLADPRFSLFIVEDRGEPIGQIRLEPRGAEHMIDVYIVPERRGRGIARVALRAALRAAGVGAAMARVKAGNAASHRLFAATGFVVAGKEGDITIYRIEGGGARHG